MGQGYSGDKRGAGNKLCKLLNSAKFTPPAAAIVLRLERGSGPGCAALSASIWTELSCVVT